MRTRRPARICRCAGQGVGNLCLHRRLQRDRVLQHVAQHLHALLRMANSRARFSKAQLASVRSSEDTL